MRSRTAVQRVSGMEANGRRTTGVIQHIGSALVGAGDLAADAYVQTSSRTASSTNSNEREFLEQRLPLFFARLDAWAHRAKNCLDELIDIVNSVPHSQERCLDFQTCEVFAPPVLRRRRSTIGNPETPRRRKGHPLRDSAEDAIKDLYSCDHPDPKRIPNRRLCKEVAEYLEERRISISADTILRAAGRRS